MEPPATAATPGAPMLCKVIYRFVQLGSLHNPLFEDATIFVHRTVKPNVRMLLPLPLPHDRRRTRLFGVEFQSKAELTRDELVHGEYYELDIVAVLLELEFALVVLISLPP
jgi:hypothetical protein